MTLKLFILLVLNIFSSVQSDYVAAVLEHAALVDEDSPSRTMKDNLEEYRNYLGIARRSKVDIMVFPEYGLTGVVENPTNFSVVIPDVGTLERNITDPIISALSEAANEHNMYVVVNVLEKANNTKNKTEYYNTNVVFDRTGKIVAKYRKINLYNEDKLTPGKITDIVDAVFTTDFGRTFGTFTCFDIMFWNPSRKILSQSERDPVTDVAYPHGWYSALPFYHSLSFHQGYAAERQVNLLSASLNVPENGQGGSGIFGADGTVYSYYLSGKESSQILISTVKTMPLSVKTGPAIQTMFLPGMPGFNDSSPSDGELANYKTPHVFKSSDYKFKLVNLSKGNISERICDGPFCCDFVMNVTVKTANTTTAIYQLMAYRGLTNIEKSKQPTKMCFLIACETKNPNTCGTRNVNNTVTFTHLSVRAKVRNLLDQYFMPVTLTTDLLPVFNTTYETLVTENVDRIIEMTNVVPQSNVLLFGIFSNGVERLTISWMLSVLVAFNLLKYFL